MQTIDCKVTCTVRGKEFGAIVQVPVDDEGKPKTDIEQMKRIGSAAFADLIEKCYKEMDVVNDLYERAVSENSAL